MLATETVHVIPVAKPWMDEQEATAARRAILSGWVTQGPEVAAFEHEFAAAVGAAHACAVANCTTALHLALLVAGVQPGDEVITVSHSFIATANAVRYCGALPVFVDIQPHTYNIDASKIRVAISPRTRAILAVHQMGLPCNLTAILAVAREFDIPVIEDAACATGSEIEINGSWQRIGKPHGDIACFSFHPRKVITTGDGGMLTTSRAGWDEQFRLLRQHAMSVRDTERHYARTVAFESYTKLGFNFRMTDIQAAVGRVQLSRLDTIVARRRALAERYRELLDDIPGLELPFEPAWARSNWQSFCVRLPSLCDQQQVMQELLDAGVSTRRGVMCAHREPAYQQEPWRCQDASCSRSPCLHLNESEHAQDSTIILPLYHTMTEADQDTVATALRHACTPQS